MNTLLHSNDPAPTGRKRSTCLALAATLTLLIAPELRADLIHLYNLNGSFADAFGGPSLTAGGSAGAGTLGSTTYTFGANQGLSLSSALPSNSTYSLLLDFSFEQLSSFRKIVDFKALTSDTGLYNLNTALNFFPVTTGPAGAFEANVLKRLVITRDASSSQFTGYVNGLPQLTFVDSGALATFTGTNSIINFFNDDAGTAGEASAGLVDRIAIYNTALSAAEVLALNGPGEISGPRVVPPPTNGVPDTGSTMAMLGGVFGVLGAMAHRFRR